MKTHKTRQLFYRKYPYKVEIRCRGIDILAKHGVDYVEEFCRNTYMIWKYRDYKRPEKDELLELAHMTGDYLDRNLKTRIEGDTLNFYLEDYDLYKEIYTHFGKFVYRKTEPNSEEDLDKLFSKNFIVLCNKFPHDRYKFKVMIDPGKIGKDKLKTTYMWIQKFGEVYHMTDTTKAWMSSPKGYMHDPYIYVESSQHLMMLQLYLSNAIKRTYEYVLRDTAINTVSEDKLCQP